MFSKVYYSHAASEFVTIPQTCDNMPAMYWQCWHVQNGMRCLSWYQHADAISLLDCREFPGEVDKIRTWFRDYKTPDGKPQNKFGYDDKAMNKEFTLGVIKETSGFYQNLLSGKTENTKGLALK